MKILSTNAIVHFYQSVICNLNLASVLGLCGQIDKILKFVVLKVFNLWQQLWLPALLQELVYGITSS